LFRKWKKSLAVMIAMAMALVLDIAVAPTITGANTVDHTTPDLIDVDFSARPTTGEAPLKVQFTDQTTVATGSFAGIPLPDVFARLAGLSQNGGTLDPNYTREWDFGDGNTSTAANPLHTYWRPGQYTVTLTLFFDYMPISVLPLGALWPDGWVGRLNGHYSVSETKILYITVYAPEEKPEPAKMVVCYLDIAPQEVVQGQELEISINMCNQGGQKGSRSVALMINGHAEQSQTVVVSPGACQTVVFRTFKTVPGSYEVWVEGATGSFSVMPLFPGYVVREAPPAEPRGIGAAGIVTIVVVLIVLAGGLVLILRRE